MIRRTLNSRPGLDFPVTKSHAFGRSMTSTYYKLDNLTAIIDNNRLQIDGFVAEVMNIEPIAAKLLACHGN
jgi:transketolase